MDFLLGSVSVCLCTDWINFGVTFYDLPFCARQILKQKHGTV